MKTVFVSNDNPRSPNENHISCIFLLCHTWNMYEEINVHIKMILCIQLHMYRCANWENIFVSLIILDNILKASHPKSYFEMNYTVYHITHAVLYKNKDTVIFLSCCITMYIHDLWTAWLLLINITLPIRLHN